MTTSRIAASEKDEGKSTNGTPLEIMASRVVTSLSAFVASLPGGPPRPLELARALSLNKDFASRLLKGLRADDPISGIQSLPGPIPLRAFLTTGVSHGADPELARKSVEAIREWDVYVRGEFGDRQSMQAALSDLVPMARARQELAAKQAVYRGMVDIKGFSVETALVAFMIHPSQSKPGRCDTALIGGSRSVRRRREGAIVHYTSSQVTDRGEGRQTVSDRQVGKDAIMRDFCRPSDLPIDISIEGERVHYTLATKGIGMRTDADFFLTEFYPGNHPLHAESLDALPRWNYATVEEPARRLVYDVHLHKSVWPDVEPRLLVFDTAVNGVADPNDPTRHRDVLKVAVHAAVMPDGPGGGLYCEGVPRYSEMVHQIAARHGWNSQDFRCIRCEISYPVYGSQICMLFRPPVRS